MDKKLITIQWENDELILLNQTKLPNEIKYETFNTIESVWDAIQTMKVRGAPAIGVSAAYGLYLGVKDVYTESSNEFITELNKCADYLATSRPTAVNLFWALDKMKEVAEKYQHEDVSTIKTELLKEAKEIHKEDEITNLKIGEYLLPELKDGMGLLTHCNAGALATTKYGTATSPMYLAHEKGWRIKVFSNETRPRLQGSMLTALELQLAGIDVTVITDNMDATLLSKGKIDAIIVGADRVASNGDTANKIGTLGVSILAKYYNVPFYVAAPTSTIDMNMESGEEIPIEERGKEEVINQFGKYTALKDSKVFNPSFDVTPFENITAIATEKGLIKPPFNVNLKEIMNK